MEIPDKILLPRGDSLDEKPYADEKLKFFSHKWLHRALYSINADERFFKAAEGKSLATNFIVDENPEWAPPCFHMVVDDGWMGEAGFGPLEDAVSVEMTYNNWADLVTGELEPILAIVTRKIKVEGIMKLLPMQDVFVAIVKATRDDPVDYW